MPISFIFLSVSRLREDEQIKKQTAFMSQFNLSTCGQSYNLLFLKEEPLTKPRSWALVWLYHSFWTVLIGDHRALARWLRVTFETKVTATSENELAHLLHSPGS